MSSTGSGQLLVAVHDVTPFHASALDRLYHLIAELGITRYALLVVPDWHGAWPVDRHTSFVDDLLRRQAAGAEVFLHGYRHDEFGLRRTPLQRLRIAGRTAGSAEFGVAPPGEVERRLDQGLALFERLGLKPVGFVPPAWLHGAGLAHQLRRRSLNVTEGFWRIANLATGGRLLAPALSWSTARRWRSGLTAGLASLRDVLEAARGVVRVAIHPPDIDDSVVAPSLRATLARLNAKRGALTYREALE